MSLSLTVTFLSILSVRLNLALTESGPSASEIAVGVSSSCRVGMSSSTRVESRVPFSYPSADAAKVTTFSTSGISSSRASTSTSTEVCRAGRMMFAGILNLDGRSQLRLIALSVADWRSAVMVRVSFPPSVTSCCLALRVSCGLVSSVSLMAVVPVM